MHPLKVLSTESRPMPDEVWQFSCLPRTDLIKANKLSDTQTDKATRRAPWPQCAFENKVFGVSCNSHLLSELAPFFIDLRAE